jgi:hypothetical protein
MKEFIRAALALFLLSLPGCGSQSSSAAESDSLRLVVFVEATNDPALNEALAQKYLKPLYQRLTSAERPLEVTIYPISANTEGETALLRFSHPDRWLTEGDAEDLADAFRELRRRYAQIYPAGSSYLVDVLGTAVLLDSELGAGRGARTEVLYLSDMIQQDDLNGYDFTEYARGKSLEQCRNELQETLGPNLRHRELFQGARVHIVYLGLDAMRRGRTDVAESSPITRRMNEIKTFWEKDFFQGFLGVQDVAAYSGTIDQALDSIFSPR